MMEEMEAELIESSEMDSKTDNLAVTEEADVDEAIPIYIEKEQNTQAYKETMEIDIDQINTYELRNKVNTIKWRPIYEVIDESYFKGYKSFSDNLMKECEDNSNEALFFPLEIKIM